MKNKSFYLILLFMGITMGFILAVQFRVTSNIAQNSSPSLDRPNALAQELDKAKETRDEQQQKVDNLREQLDQAAGGPELARVKESLDRAREEAGLTELQGPGVEVTLNDSNNVLQPGENPNFYVLHDGDVLSILNELKAAGAKAISINGQRLISTSEVRCIGPTILVNKNQRLSPPFIVYALGNPETLAGALKMKGGVVESLQIWGIQVDVKKVDKVVITPYSGGLVFDYAKPTK
ncbi:Uncharacterized conserved protein YlxW, UPF0749 family [Desulfotomaculum arcticum]|uniref:Uncharacterized conserved protein YlxW, UPF0749 family n=1 Tax=Desulfotruncus arcticus DSM 17038 TaxID=1121424 RepID=A0A1I2QNB2_9FIRM|nr:DUF881 domain-containing protein [Desulfotruncus arcticus]SFG28809.1 Uncharacterized conserved protein YlxW, UPF0749 family [Desulfotomaculum arcticum] [Desulfotruncus arcticus DSM 17038]